MKNLRLLSVLSLSAAFAGTAMANDYLTDEVFGEPVVEVNGSTVTYSFPDAEDGIYDLFMDANMWRNQSKAINYCAADGTIIETSHIGAWDNDATFACTLDFSAGQYLYFAEGIFQIDVFDDEGETYEKYYSPAYTYTVDMPVSISAIQQGHQQAIYSLDGKLLQQPTQGFCIMEGRKVMVK